MRVVPQTLSQLLHCRVDVISRLWPFLTLEAQSLPGGPPRVIPLKLKCGHRWVVIFQLPQYRRPLAVRLLLLGELPRGTLFLPLLTLGAVPKDGSSCLLFMTEVAPGLISRRFWLLYCKTWRTMSSAVINRSPLCLVPTQLPLRVSC